MRAHHLTVISRCAACGNEPLVHGHPISTTELADAWRREDEAVGANDTACHRFETLLATMPAEVRFDRCSHCGLQVASPPIVWSSSTYPRDQSYPLRWEFQRAVEDLGAAPLNVLELGCGTGHFLALASAHGHRAVGLDFSAPAVGRAQARGLNAFCGGVDDLPGIAQSAERFDAVAMFHLIEHLADPAALLRAIGRWLRPQARIFLSCPGPRRFTRLIREQQVGGSDFWDYPPQHVARWTLPALRALLENGGWRVTAAVEEPFSWTAAASHIGVARAIYRRRLHRPLARRAMIAAAWLRLALEPGHRVGVSLYTTAVREASGR